MSFIKNLRIGTRLGTGFAVVIVAGLAIAVAGKLALSQVDSELHVLIDDRTARIDELRDMRDNLNEIARSVRNIALLEDATAMAAEAARIAEARAANFKLSDALVAAIQSTEGKAMLAAMAEARARYIPEVDKAVALGRANDLPGARTQILGPLVEPQQAYFKAIEDLVVYEQDKMASATTSVTGLVQFASLLMLGVALAAAAGGAFVAWTVARSVTRPLQRAVEATDRIAEGDLTGVIEVDSRDEVGQLLDALSRMQSNLSRVVGSVRGNADSVATASAQIAQGNQDLSSRTEEQASSLQQTAASMEQLGSTVKQNADNARRANQLAEGASAVAVKGGEVVDEVVQTMRGIQDSSQRIADIIGTIDGIAFQTNILALNAAVEAARAGEQGRGFAVVASEVRGLAQRSAEAAKEIKALITDSVERVQNGTALVDRAGATMDEVVTAIRRVNDIMGEISGASEEQSRGVGQVGEAVGQMDRATQQNAALVEESAAAAESLSLQAKALVDAVAVFRLAAGTGGLGPVPKLAGQPRLASPRPPQRAAAADPPAVRPAPGVTPRPAAAPAATAGIDEDWASF